MIKQRQRRPFSGLQQPCFGIFAFRMVHFDLADFNYYTLKSHESDYRPFIEVDDFDEYTIKLSKGEIQGGEVEIRIASILLDISIEVVQWNDKNGVLRNNFEGGKEKIIISYYKHMMDTSAHYNGTRQK